VVFTTVTLVGVIAAGLGAGFALSRRLWLLAVSAAIGVGAMIAVFVEFALLPNPGGEGWADRYDVSGHWVPIWQCNLVEASVFGWIFALAAASFLARIFR
jgi:hypothetical protein